MSCLVGDWSIPCFSCPVLFGVVAAEGELLLNRCTRGLHHECGGEPYIQIYHATTNHTSRVVSWLSPAGVTYHHATYPGRAIPYIRLFRRAGTPSRRHSCRDKLPITIMPRHTLKTHHSSRVSQTCAWYLLCIIAYRKPGLETFSVKPWSQVSSRTPPPGRNMPPSRSRLGSAQHSHCSSICIECCC